PRRYSIVVIWSSKLIYSSIYTSRISMVMESRNNPCVNSKFLPPNHYQIEMRNFIIIIILLFNNRSNAQKIKSFDCIRSQKDSILIYNLKVKFDSPGEEKTRIELVKTELEKKHQIKTDDIISIESF